MSCCMETRLKVNEMLLLVGKLGTNSPKRAAQVRKVIERLGPAYVKVAQAVSTRVDLLDANYLREIERLQDRVPPFPTKAALPVMTEGQPQPLALLCLNLRCLMTHSCGLLWPCSHNELALDVLTDFTCHLLMVSPAWSSACDFGRMRSHHCIAPLETQH